MYLFICYSNIIHNISSVFDIFPKIKYYIPNKLLDGYQSKKKNDKYKCFWFWYVIKNSVHISFHG